LEDREGREIKGITEKASLALEDEKLTRRNLEAKLVQQLEDKIGGMSSKVFREKKVQEENRVNLETRIADELYSIKGELDASRKDREESNARLVGEIEGQLTKFKENFLIERKVAASPCDAYGVGERGDAEQYIPYGRRHSHEATGRNSGMVVMVLLVDVRIAIEERKRIDT
jgi:hypothetical protein